MYIIILLWNVPLHSSVAHGRELWQSHFCVLVFAGRIHTFISIDFNQIRYQRMWTPMPIPFRLTLFLSRDSHFESVLSRRCRKATSCTRHSSGFMSSKFYLKWWWLCLYACIPTVTWLRHHKSNHFVSGKWGIFTFGFSCVCVCVCVTFCAHYNYYYYYFWKPMLVGTNPGLSLQHLDKIN